MKIREIINLIEAATQEQISEMARFKFQMKTWSPYNGCHKSINTDPQVTITKQSRGKWQLAWGEYVANEDSYRDALEHVENAINMGDGFSEPIKLVSKPNITEARIEYPKRQGNSPAAYRQFILAVMHWKQKKYGDPKWDGVVGESLSKTGIKIAQRMEQEGIVQVSQSSEQNHVMRGGPRTGTAYRNDIDSYMRFAIAPGPNFPLA